ncbi:Ca2+-dependent phosphoinositide-specific phospholipase C [Pleionea sp. CnH1-48]|uniref:Ca2+-dependent phosphoinositide-specific phospholipase C n=1 Tax=Pleionea sp. CnH1-48 TaxID=2954494 RepID=UPI0020970DF4|nr:Ca2+-dependent phosphoinositide-specific phospholipase C [Pleionea sp. CnH1-48]MCO7224229.1 Ca2+-dependent phosphoinositide-specific phospholipase C [Pleionea sp. CnH1-48]
MKKLLLSCSLAALALMSHSSEARQFEGFWKGSYNNDRVGLDYHNGQYGQKWLDGWQQRCKSQYQPYTGDCYFFAGAGAEAELYQELPATAGKRYLFSAKLKGYSGDYDRARLKLAFYDANNNLLQSHSGAAVSGSNWTAKSLTRYAPASTAKVRVILRCERAGGVNCDGYFDHVGLKEDSSNNLLKNPGAELPIGDDTNQAWVDANPNRTRWQNRVTSSSDSTPYNYWFSYGTHNTYEHDKSTKNGVYGYLRDYSSVMELDMTFGDDGHMAPGEFEIEHPGSRDNKANCRAYYSSPTIQSDVTLRECLRAIKEFHNDYPNHHVITLWIEMKEKDWHSQWSPADFNTTLHEELKDFIYTPQNFLDKHNANTLRAAADAGWPTLGELRGKVVVVLFQHLKSNQLLRDYIDDSIAAENSPGVQAFVAPLVNRYGTVSKNYGTVDKPANFDSDEQKSDVVFYSLRGNSYSNKSFGLNIFANNRVSSTFYCDDNSTPGVAEHRDFLIQHCRWGNAVNTGENNPLTAYSGRLLIESGNKVQLETAVVNFKTATSANDACLEIEGGSTSDRADIIHSNCDHQVRQKFAVIDTAVDYSGGFPSSRAYMIQSAIPGNQKVVEVAGHNTPEVGDEVFQFARENSSRQNRPEDQYWIFNKEDNTQCSIRSYSDTSLHLHSSTTRASLSDVSPFGSGELWRIESAQ